MKELILSKETYLNFSLGEFGRRANSPYFNAEVGEHYKLLAFISSLMSEGSLLADLGTYQGYSAYALSFNQKVRVISYGIEGAIAPEIRSLPNVIYIEDSYANHWENILKSNLILVDLNHNGIEEKEIYKNLKEANWEGVLILDDIKLSPDMIDFFDSIDLPKFDITAHGHFSGTGIVPFNMDMVIFGHGVVTVDLPCEESSCVEISPEEKSVKEEEITTELVEENTAKATRSKKSQE